MILSPGVSGGIWGCLGIKEYLGVSEGIKEYLGVSRGN